MTSTPEIHEVSYKLFEDGNGFEAHIEGTVTTVDLIEKTIKVNAALDAENLHTHCKRVWVHAELMNHAFPFESMEGGGVAMSPDWRFANFASRKYVEPQILEFKPVRPEPPAAPETVLTYPPQVFDPGTPIDEIARKVPRGVNYQATRLFARSDGRLQMEIPGQWKNQFLDEDMKLFESHMEDFKKDFKTYLKNIKRWNATHPDALIGPGS